MRGEFKIGLLVGYYIAVLWSVANFSIFVAAGISILGGVVVDKLFNRK